MSDSHTHPIPPADNDQLVLSRDEAQVSIGLNLDPFIGVGGVTLGREVEIIEFPETKKSEPTNYASMETDTVREGLKPPVGLEIGIEKDDVAREVFRQLDICRRVIGGETLSSEEELHAGQPSVGAIDVIGRLADLSALYVQESDFENLHRTITAQGNSQDEATQIVDKIKWTHMDRVAKVLEHSMRGDDLVAHTGHVGEIVIDGSVKPRGKLMQEGKYFAGSGHLQRTKFTPQQISEAMNDDASRDGYGTTTHSMLVHARQTTEIGSMHSAVYIPVASVIDRTPVVIAGQDQNRSTGVRVRGNDEAHGNNKTRHQFGAVEVVATPQYLDTLPKVIQREMINDFAFMPENPTAETAYDYELDIAEGVVLVDETHARHLIGVIAERLPEDSDTRSVASIMSELSKGNLFGINTKLRDLIEKKKTDPSVNPYASETSERVWESLINELKEVEEVFGGSLEGVYDTDLDDANSAFRDTAIMRLLLRNTGGEDQANSVFVTPNVNHGEKLNSVFSTILSNYTRAKSNSSTSTRYLEFKQIQLDFTQTEMAKSALDQYKSQHNI